MDGFTRQNVVGAFGAGPPPAFLDKPGPSRQWATTPRSSSRFTTSSTTPSRSATATSPPRSPRLSRIASYFLAAAPTWTRHSPTLRPRTSPGQSGAPPPRGWQGSLFLSCSTGQICEPAGTLEDLRLGVVGSRLRQRVPLREPARPGERSTVVVNYSDPVNGFAADAANGTLPRWPTLTPSSSRKNVENDEHPAYHVQLGRSSSLTRSTRC